MTGKEPRFFVERYSLSYSPTSRSHQTEIEIVWRRLNALQQETVMTKIVNSLNPEQFPVPEERMIESQILACWITDMVSSFNFSSRLLLQDPRYAIDASDEGF